MSRQLHPGLALVGERCPFVCPLPFSNIVGGLVSDEFVVDFAVRPDSLRTLIGLLLFDLALLSTAESSPSSISSIEA